MSETWVIHWANKCEQGLRAIIGDQAACVREIVAGDEFMADEVVLIEVSDPDEGWAKYVPLEEIAREVASYEADNGGEITTPVRDFIEHYGGLAMARGLRVIDRTFSAA